MSVKEAAERLGVHESRVRALISSGLLEARKVGGRWLVDPSSVSVRASASPPRGRPWSPELAWERLIALQSPPSEYLHFRNLALLDSARSRRPLREGRRLVEVLDGAPITELLARLRRRATPNRFRTHPGLLNKLREDPALVPTGTSASQHHGLDLYSEEVDAYIAPTHLQRLVERYRLEASDRPNVVLRIVNGRWPFEEGDKVAPQSVVAIDLMESNDERLRRAGLELWDQVLSKWRIE